MNIDRIIFEWALPALVQALVAYFTEAFLNYAHAAR